jgi:hypothetical protein
MSIDKMGEAYHDFSNGFRTLHFGSMETGSFLLVGCGIVYDCFGDRLCEKGV